MKKRLIIFTYLLSLFLTDVVLATSGTTNATSRLSSGLATTTKQIFDLNDFPTPVAGVITLGASVSYQINGTIDVSPNTIKANVSNKIGGADPFNDILTTTASGSFIVGINDNVVIQNLTVIAPNAQCLDFKNTAGNEKTSIFSANDMILICDKLGTFENMFRVGLFTGGSPIGSNGFTFIGSQNGIHQSRSWDIAGITGTNIAYDFGTSVFDAILISSGEFTSTATNIYISGATGSANLNPSSTGRVFHSPTIGTSPNLVGIDPSDSRWFFFDNNDIENSPIDTSAIDLLGDTSGVLTLNAAATVTDYTLTFPPAQGITDQILKLDSSGDFQWVTDIAGGDVDTVSGGVNINVTGTATNPIVNLVDDVSTNSILLTDTGGGSGAALRVESSDPAIGIRETDATLDNKQWDFVAVSEQLRFRILDDANVSGINWLEVNRTAAVIDSIVLPRGNVGVGTNFNTNSPQAPLHIRAGLSGQLIPTVDTILEIESDGDAFISIISPNADTRGLIFGDPSDRSHAGIEYNRTGVGGSPNGFQFFLNSGNTAFYMDESRGVGVGNAGVTNTDVVFQIDSVTRGFVKPRMTTAERDLMSASTVGLEIYNITTNKPQFFDGSTWINNGPTAPGGSNTQVQFNNSGTFDGISGVTTSGSNLIFSDSSAANFGTGLDLTLSHNGTVSRMVNTTGVLEIVQSGVGSVLRIENTNANQDIIMALGSQTNAASFAVHDSLDIVLFAVNANGRMSVGEEIAASTVHMVEETTGTGASVGMTIEQLDTGDSLLQFLLSIADSQRWVMGIDNSDANKFKIASTANLSTNTALTIDTAGNADFASALTAGSIEAFGSPGQIQYNSAGNLAGAPNITTNGTDLVFADDADAIFGNSTDLTIRHTGTDNQIVSNTGKFSLFSNGSDDFVLSSGGLNTDIVFRLGSSTSSTQFAFKNIAGADMLVMNGARDIAFGTGIDITSIGTRLDLSDNSVLRIGTGSDLSIFHDGTNSVLVNQGGGLLIQQNAAADLTLHNLNATNNIVMQLGSTTDATKSIIQDSADVALFTVTGAGDIGINKVDPDALFHIVVSDTATNPPANADFVLEKLGNNIFQFLGANSDHQEIRFHTSANTFRGKMGWNEATTPGGYQFKTGTDDLGLVVDQNQQVGVGPSAPTNPVSSLHIRENTTTSGPTTGVTIEQQNVSGEALLHFKDAFADFTMGMDNDDDNQFYITPGTSINTSQGLNIDRTTGRVSIGAVSGGTNQLNVAGDISVTTGNGYNVQSVEVLSATTLGSGVVNSSLTNVGTLTSLDVTNDLTVASSLIFADVSNGTVTIGNSVTGTDRFNVFGGGFAGVQTGIAAFYDSAGALKFRLRDEVTASSIPPRIEANSALGLAFNTVSDAPFVWYVNAPGVPSAANEEMRLTSTGLNIDGTATASSFNGVALTTAGVSTNYLDETGNYSAPVGLQETLAETLTNGNITGGTDIVISSSDQISMLNGSDIKFSGGAGNNFIRGNVGNSGRIGILTENLERITISLAGNVGIKNTTPNVPLDVTGAAEISGLLTAGSITAFGSNDQLQVNSAGVLSGTVGLTYDGNSLTLGTGKIFNLGDNAELQIEFSDITNASSFQNFTGELQFVQNVFSSDIVFITGSPTSSSSVTIKNSSGTEIAVFNGAGDVSIPNGNFNLIGNSILDGGQTVKRTPVADADYTILTSDYIIAYTSITVDRTINLPPAATAGVGKVYVIKDESGNVGGAIELIIEPNGTETIDGVANFELTNPFNSVTIYTDGSNWFISHLLGI